MSANRLHVGIGLGILLLSVFECIQAYPHLPDPMASSFGGDGTPGGKRVRLVRRLRRADRVNVIGEKAPIISSKAS